MVNKTLAGRCGIYCGSCGLYRAYKDGGEYLRRISEEWKMPLETIRCEGCHALTPDCAGAECRIAHCLDSKGLEYCFECPEYATNSCDRYRELAGKWAKDGVDLRANLARIKAGDIDRWLTECKKSFSCSRCGQPLPVAGWNIMKKCYHCGSDLPGR
jgi:hypothetical protein